MGRERGREISGVSSSSQKDQSYHIRAPPTGPHLTLTTSLVVQSSSHIRLFLTPLTATPQASLSFIISQSLLKLTSIESVMPSNHLILCHPFSCLQSFPASGSFPMSQFFPSAGQSIGASASALVLPMNIQLISFRIDWFDLLAKRPYFQIQSQLGLEI